MSVPEIRDLDSLLLKHLEPNVEILKYDSRMLTSPGENFGSVILAVDVTVRKSGIEDVIHLVAKLCPPNDLLCKMFNIQVSFQKEMGMYTNVIPCLKEFQDQHNVRDNISELFVRFYGARINLDGSDTVDKDAVLLLENIKYHGYDVCDRLIGFDEDHTTMILKDLARFHAVPIALRIIKPDEFNAVVLPCVKEIKVWEGVESDELDMYITSITDVLVRRDECVPYINSVISTIKYSMDAIYRNTLGTGPFATIAHTDYWVNNTMILKNDRGEPIKNKIVDLQMVIYQTLVYDLLFFLYSSVQPKVLYKYFDKFIDLYYESFINKLREFQVDVHPFSRDAFDNELKVRAFYELGHILVMYKPILTERGKITDMSIIDTDLMYKEKVNNSDYEQRLIDCVLSFIKNNWIPI